MTKRKMLKSLAFCALLIMVVGVLYGIFQTQKTKEDKRQLIVAVPIVGQDHYFDEEAQHFLGTIKEMIPLNSKKLSHFNELLKTYFIYDSFEMIDIEYELLLEHDVKTQVQEVIDKKNNRYYVKETDRTSTLVKVYEQGDFYYIDEQQQQYVQEKVGSKESEFKSSLGNYGFDLRFSEYVLMLMSVIENGNEYTVDMEKDEFVMMGKIDGNQSEALTGEFEFISDRKSGMIKLLRFTSDNQVLYQATNMSVDLSPIFIERVSFLPELTDYEKTTMDLLINK